MSLELFLLSYQKKSKLFHLALKITAPGLQFIFPGLSSIVLLYSTQKETLMSHKFILYFPFSAYSHIHASFQPMVLCIHHISLANLLDSLTYSLLQEAFCNSSAVRDLSFSTLHPFFLLLGHLEIITITATIETTNIKVE